MLIKFNQCSAILDPKVVETIKISENLMHNNILMHMDSALKQDGRQKKVFKNIGWLPAGYIAQLF